MKEIQARKKVLAQSRAWFQDWANDYDNTLGKMRRHHQLLELAVQMSGIKADARVLDIGCGTGLLSLKFLQAKPCEITAVDNTAKMLEIFRNKIKKLSLQKAITLMLMDAEHLDLKPNYFDVAAATVVLHHMDHAKLSALRRIRSLLKPGGTFVMGELDVDTSGAHTDVKRLKHILDYLDQELVLALEDSDIPAVKRMYINGLKHIFNDGEYCISARQWAGLCKQAGFKKIRIQPLPTMRKMFVLAATK
jgi:ubiquinone/menaquinone biosynthesis C-methylase UbiE